MGSDFNQSLNNSFDNLKNLTQLDLELSFIVQ